MDTRIVMTDMNTSEIEQSQATEDILLQNRNEQSEVGRNELLQSEINSNATELDQKLACEPENSSENPEGEQGSENADPVTDHRTSGGISIEISTVPAVNYALAQNGMPSIQRIVIHNHRNEPLENTVLTIEGNSDICILQSMPVSYIPAKKSFELKNLNLSLDEAILAGLTEQEKITLQVSLKKDIQVRTKREAEIPAAPSMVTDGNPETSVSNLTQIDVEADDENQPQMIIRTITLAQTSTNIIILPFDSWSGYSTYPELLTSFSLPNHPSLIPIQHRAAELMNEWTGDASLDGYLSEDSNRVLNLAAAMYCALAEQEIVYVVPPATFQEVGQRVRLCDQVLQNKLGTCLDLTLLYSACLESIGLNPVMILKKGHIFAGLWLENKMFPESIQDDVSLISKRMADGVNEMIVVECTQFTTGRNVVSNQANVIPADGLQSEKYVFANKNSFDTARTNAESELTDDDFECIIDVKRARMTGIVPLPIRVQGEHGWEILKEDKDKSKPTEAPDALVDKVIVEEPRTIEKLTKKEQWERKLLDLGMRNTLINMRLTSSIIPILISSIDQLEDQLSDGIEFSLQPRPKEWDKKASDYSFETMHQVEDVSSILEEEFHNKRLRSSLTEAELETSVKNLYRAAKSSMEENGANTLYLAVGLLRWYENAKSVKERYAPILLIPVDLIRKLGHKNYVLRLRDDDPQVNITLLEKLKQDFNIDVQGLDPVPTDEHGVDIRKTFTVIRKAVMNQKNWDVLESAYLGIFSFSQFVMWNDIRNRSDDLEKNKIVKSLMDGKLCWEAEEMKAEAGMEDEEVLLPIAADASQLYAIQSASKGESFVLHGPPGTGKSQTITAMIANALAQGKSVLFVAEKMAALEVVQRRLNNIGIGPFCLELHSNKSKKKDVLEQLRIASEVSTDYSPEEYARKAEEMRILRGDLDIYGKHLHALQYCGLSVYEMIQRYEAHESALDIDGFSREVVGTIDALDLERKDKLVDRLVSAGQLVGHPSGHPLHNIHVSQYSQYLKNDYQPVIKAYREALDEFGHSLEHFVTGIDVKLPKNSKDDIGEAHCANEEDGDNVNKTNVLDVKKLQSKEIQSIMESASEALTWRERPAVWTETDKSNSDEVTEDILSTLNQWTHALSEAENVIDFRNTIAGLAGTERQNINQEEIGNADRADNQTYIGIVDRAGNQAYTGNADRVGNQAYTGNTDRAGNQAGSENTDRTLGCRQNVFEQLWNQTDQIPAILADLESAMASYNKTLSMKDELLSTWEDGVFALDLQKITDLLKEDPGKCFAIDAHMQSRISDLIDLANHEIECNRLKSQLLQNWQEGFLTQDAGSLSNQLVEVQSKNFLTRGFALTKLFNSISNYALRADLKNDLPNQFLLLTQYQKEKLLCEEGFAKQEKLIREIYGKRELDWNLIYAECMNAENQNSYNIVEKLNQWSVKEQLAPYCKTEIPISGIAYYAEQLTEYQSAKNAGDENFVKYSDLLVRSSLDLGLRNLSDAKVSIEKLSTDSFGIQMLLQLRNHPEKEELFTHLLDSEKQMEDAKLDLENLLEVEEEAESKDTCSGWIETQISMCDRLLAHQDELKEWINWNRLVAEAEQEDLYNIVDAYVGGLDHDMVKASYEKALYKAFILMYVDQDEVLNTFDGAIFNEKIKQFKQLDEELTQVARKEIYYRLAARVPNFQKEAAHSSEVGILQRAIRSGGRGLSIRNLFEQIPNLLPRLCPCMLMSPISAAQYLDPKREPFDLVVFDEASQLPTAKAVGALARGRDAVVVGDPKQMPPTAFFVSNRVDEDNLDVEDLESILDDCLALNMPQTHLLWHYRSRHESLIAFSNSQFYENKLYTFPSVNDRESKVSLVPVDGIFERVGNKRHNVAEATAIVDELIRRSKDPELSKYSVGIVTFNIPQQNLIDDMLSDACENDEDLARWAYESEEPVFIKNLENVQGDERDVILFSIGYGPDEKGRVYMNFGPLNRDGGWRRLNVAVSRARQEMIVYSTLKPEQIDLNKSSSLGVTALRNFLEYASGKELCLDVNSAATGRIQAEEYAGITETVCRFLKEHGYDTDTAVGNSEYRVDIGVIDPRDTDRYILGIILDGSNYKNAKTTRDREIAQNSVLAGLGWKLLRIWSMDWWDNKDKELNRILGELEELSRPEVEAETEPCEITSTECAEIENGEMTAETTTIAEAGTDSETGGMISEAGTDSEAVEKTVDRSIAATEDFCKKSQGEESANKQAEMDTPHVYQATDLPKIEGGTSEFMEKHSNRAILDDILAVVEQEAPIKESLLVKRIAQSFGVTRSGAKIQAKMDYLIEYLMGNAKLKSYKEGEDTVFWKLDQNPDDYSDFRKNGTGDSKRDAKDVPVQEAANALCLVLYEAVSMDEESLIRESAKHMGYARVTAAVTDTFKNALEYAKAKKRIEIGLKDRLIISQEESSKY